MRWSIRVKLTLIFLFFVVITIFLVLYAYRVSENALEKRIGQGLQRQASIMINQIDSMLFERYRNIQNWASNEIMVDVLTGDDTGRISEFLATMKKEYGLYSDLIYADNAGKVIAASHPRLLGRNVYDEGWFQRVLAEKEIQSQGPRRSEFIGGYACTFAAPARTSVLLKKSKSLNAQGRESQNLLETLAAWKPESLGVLAAFLDWSEVINLVNSTPILEEDEQNEEAYAILMGQDGLALTQPYFDHQAVMFHANLFDLNLRAAKEAQKGLTGYTLEKGRYGENDFIGFAASKGYRDFQGFGWSVLVFQRTTTALAPIRMLQIQIIGFGTLFAILLIVVSIAVSRGMTQPLEKLVDMTKAVARHDFSGTVEVKSRDEIGALASSFNDMIQDLKKAETDLMVARDYADNIVRSTIDALFVTDNEGKILRCNPAVTNLLGFEEAELLNQPISYLIEEPFNPKNNIPALVREKRVFSAEMDYRTKDGKIIPMLVSATPMKNPAGQDEGIVVVAKDVTDFRDLEHQFQRAQKMDAVGRLAGGIAHDFNNMLTVINGYSEKIIRKIGMEDPRGGEVGQILKAGKRAAGLVRQLLTFSRRQIIKPTVVNFNELLLSMHKMLRHMMGENIEVVALPSDGLWPVKIDPGQFEQVLANLAVNARDAMPEGGKFVMKTENIIVSEAVANQKPGMKAGEYMLLTCQDTGTGMSEDIRSRIFEPFFTTKEQGKGTGLGLATCYGMVKQAGGYIDVESEIGKGTAFKIYLPKSAGDIKSLSEVEGPAELPRGQETILVVEDEDLVRDLAVSVLQEQGYTVMVACNGSEALQFVNERRKAGIDLILTDVVMPKIGGRELVEKISAIYPGIKVLFMSGYVDDETVHTSAVNAKIAFLPKPITPSALAIKVRNVLDGKESAFDEI